MGEVVRRGRPSNDDELTLWWVGSHPSENKAVDHDEPKYLLVDRSECSRAHPGHIEPGQEEENTNRPEHGDYAQQLVRNRPENGVKRQEVPFGYDVRRRQQRVGRCIIVGMAEEIGVEEHEISEHQEKNPHTGQVLDGVVGVEGNGVLGHFDVDAQGVVRLVDV